MLWLACACVAWALYAIHGFHAYGLRLTVNKLLGDQFTVRVTSLPATALITDVSFEYDNTVFELEQTRDNLDPDLWFFKALKVGQGTITAKAKNIKGGAVSSTSEVISVFPLANTLMVLVS